MQNVFDRVTPILDEAKRRGFLGPGALLPHVGHALAMARAAPGAPGRFVDLGCGGGVPGLVLACIWGRAEAVLVEVQSRRAEFLERAVARLGLEDRSRVICERAEIAARDPELRGQADVVVARLFGAPAVTAECAVGFLRPGGALVVSEPPVVDVDRRWPADRVEVLGLRLAGVSRIDGASFARLTLVHEPDQRWPRRVGTVEKRPIW